MPFSSLNLTCVYICYTDLVMNDICFPKETSSKVLFSFSSSSLRFCYSYRQRKLKVTVFWIPALKDNIFSLYSKTVWSFFFSFKNKHTHTHKKSHANIIQRLFLSVRLLSKMQILIKNTFHWTKSEMLTFKQTKSILIRL